MASIPGSQDPFSILIVEDDKEAIVSLELTVRRKYANSTVHVAESGQDGFERYQSVRPDIVITDINMPGLNGIQMAERIKALDPGAKIIAATAVSEIRYLMEAVKIGISRYMLKPIEFDALFECIDECLARVIMERRVKSQNEMIGRLSRIIEQSTDMVLITGSDGTIEYLNPRFSEVTQYAAHEVLGREFRALLSGPGTPQGLEEVWEALSCGTGWQGEICSSKKDGEEFCAALSASLLDNEEGSGRRFVVILQDVTEKKRAQEERRRMEEQMLHAQKLESLGVLAGGIAHDFNNILMSIIGNADLALMRINRESPAVENLRQIEKASSRAADLARQMLAYSGKGKFVVENLDLNVLLEEMLHMLEVSISKKARLRLNLTRPLPSVEVDATQLRQIVMNLVINASEAIGDQNGVIAISTGCLECDKEYLQSVWLSGNIREGSYVYLEVTDTGCGMTKETLARVFDPFFTTKFSGRGLGMAAVLGIVKGHQGAIRIYSEPGRGTTLKILLPASDRPAHAAARPEPKSDWQGSGLVLLVDDEETVREIGAEMLRALGYLPITADNGLDAVAVYRNTPGIAFVILDLTMPQLDGEQCFRELRRIDPTVKVIMTSGYNEHEVTQKFAGKGLAGFMQKPYKVSELREIIAALNLPQPGQEKE